MIRRALTLFAAAAALVSMHPGQARAQAAEEPAEHRDGSLGFHDVDAPLGVRWWFSGQKVGLDLGAGFQSNSAGPVGYPNDHLKTFAVAAGVPLTLKSWRQVHFLFRPGIFYQNEQVRASVPPEPFATENQKTIRVTGELEAEAFLLDNFSVSASHGIGWSQFDPGFGADKETSFGTLGRGFTSVGFHLYLFGGS